MPAFFKQKQSLLIFASVVAIALVGVAAFFIFSQSKIANNPTPTTSTKTNQATKSAETSITTTVSWQWGGTNWISSSSPPACLTPLLTDLPVDINQITSILYPGQTRGGNYKAHGGFRFGSDNNITVIAPLEANLVEGSRYIEGGQRWNTMPLSAAVRIPFEFKLRIPKPRKSRHIIERDTLGRIVQSAV